MLSSRARYATRALLHLSLRYDQGPILIQEVADAQNIPLKYLQQILVALKAAGFVQSRKGPGGGYALSRPPETITLGSVIRAMDGALDPISCVSDSAYSECGCPHPDACSIRERFVEVREAIDQILDSTDFGALRDRQKSMSGYANTLDFII